MDALEVLRQVFFETGQKYPMVLFVAVLLLANLFTGILVALLPNNDRRFYLGRLGDWMFRVLIFIGGGGVVSALRLVAPEQYSIFFNAFEAAAWISIIGTMIGKIIANLRLILPDGTKIPQELGDASTPTTEARP